MPVITLPDGSQKTFEENVSVMDVAASIGAGLAKATLAGKVNGTTVNHDHLIEEDADLQIITEKDDEGLDIIRHSAAHLMAHAVKQLYPEAQVTIGPSIEDGFYYDFSYERSFVPEDLAAIEKKMKELAKANIEITRKVMDRDEAIEFFNSIGEKYKAEIISDIPAGEQISLYEQGDFIDLCRGPHVPSTGKIKSVKVMKVAGAYWRGNSDNEMLQRIYATAWRDKKELKAYLLRLEEAEKRDHRKIGKALNLFHMQEEAPGMVFWHEKGWSIYLTIQDYIRKLVRRNGYHEVRTPQMISRVLWEKSGHWDKFHEEMFTTASEQRDYAVKPMNCPGHVQIFNQGVKSYRDLPYRICEFGDCHRNEPSGTLQGTMRVRGFVQDDGHIFCTEDQIQSEVADFIDLVFKTYGDFGFEDITIALATRPDKRVGDDEVWDKAEKALEIALKEKGLEFTVKPGEGAFYGPKIEFTMRDCLNRGWQLGTVQVDFSMAGRLDAQYVAEDGQRKHPVLIHRAILGSLERFIGILIEHHAGIMPTWLSPVQVAVMSITDRQVDFVKSVEKKLLNNDIRVISDLRNEKIGFKIREHTLQRVPYMLVIGDRESEESKVAVRTRDGRDLGVMSVDEFLDKIQTDIVNFGNEAVEE